MTRRSGAAATAVLLSVQPLIRWGSVWDGVALHTKEGDANTHMSCAGSMVNSPAAPIVLWKHPPAELALSTPETRNRCQHATRHRTTLVIPEELLRGGFRGPLI
jgi:hypothetical protein